MTQSNDIPVVDLTGLPRERGRVHGEALRPIIAQAVERWKDALHHETGLQPDDYLTRFVEATDFVPAIERYAPRLLDEVRGIADGAALTFRDAYAYQLMDEEWSFRTALRHDGGADLEHCSVIGVFGEDDGPAILAQNMDLPKYYDGAQTLLRVTDDESGSESLLFTPAGIIGTCGVSRAGVGLCVNTLARLHSSPRGLPVAFIVRRLLEQRTVDDAVAFVSGVPHASGQNYAIGDRKRMVDLECSAGRVVPFVARPTRLYHTNHALANDDHLSGSPSVAAGAGGKGSVTAPNPETALSNSEQRFAFLEQALDGDERLTVERVQALLSTRDVPISVGRTGPGSGMTLGSLVMELTLPPVLHLAAGPPAETPYGRWSFA